MSNNELTDEDTQAMQRVIEALDYVYHRLDKACGITKNGSMDSETQLEELDTIVNNVFNYLEENLKDI